MEPTTEHRPRSWPVARFPSHGVRETFLQQLRLWNLIEDLPRVDAEPLQDGRRIRFWSTEDQRTGLLLLIDSFGGRVVLDR